MILTTTANDIIADIPTRNLGSTLHEDEPRSFLTFVARQANPSPFNPVEAETDDDSTSGNTKKALEYLFISLAILVVGALLYRSMIIRAKRKQLRAAGFYHNSEGESHYGPRRGQMPMFDPYDSQSYPPRWGAMPAAHLNPTGQTVRRTRAEDIDAGGRRIGDRNAELDHGRLGDKDALPAYDMNGGPPKYVDIQSAPHQSADGTGVPTRPAASTTGIPDTVPPTVNSGQPGELREVSSEDPHLFPLPRR
ncbi:hypothetical protein CVT24_003780 [Panaeolus cyanescens]|uniref:Uncharacterized protein n=1 Tax=Panaeolus cyanescens TaxID=181874 RepID=A0A409VUS4_9AGAR|nr:hypothetical protein CVT24_003780 [Panaeolus cyanescens]